MSASAQHWTPEQVEARLLEAGQALRRQRERVGPAGYKVAWPDMRHDFWERYGQQPTQCAPAQNAAWQTSQMDEAMGWLALLPMPQRQVVAWRCISGWSWRRISQALRVAKSTAHDRYQAALVTLCERLSGGYLRDFKIVGNRSSIPDRNAA